MGFERDLKMDKLGANQISTELQKLLQGNTPRTALLLKSPVFEL